METPKKTLHVDFDAILDIAHKGVRRAAVFLGLGLNAANNKNFKEYRLSNITKIDLVNANADDVAVEGFKAEFAIWLVGNGLRELMETFYVFLDRLFEACVAFRMTKVVDRPCNDDKELLEKFRYAGLAEKLRLFGEEFQMEPTQASYLLSINKARNCLTHRRGIVGKEDIGSSDALHLKWMGMEVFIKTPDGEEIPFIPTGASGEIELKNGGSVMYRSPERVRSFRLGERILLSAVDLSEMCQVLAHNATALAENGLAYAKELGVTILSKEKPQTG